MHLPEGRWTEIELVSEEYVFDLIAMHSPGSRWKEKELASAEH
jgi:hypothetical protein